MSRFTSSRFALEAGMSLFMDSPDFPSVRRRPLLNELAQSPIQEPLNNENFVFAEFCGIVDSRDISNIRSNSIHPYWLPNMDYDLFEVLGTCVQFFDQHDAPLPETTLPPARDLEVFINFILSREKVFTIDQQFQLLLDISGSNVAGAANLGMLATRFMSRFADQRAYPSLEIGGQVITKATSDSEISHIMKAWNKRMARFETAKTCEKNDGTGDQYYFWTHFFASCMFDPSTLIGRNMQNVFQHGNKLMVIAKDKIARRGGVVSSHREASIMGRTVGLKLCSL